MRREVGEPSVALMDDIAYSRHGRVRGACKARIWVALTSCLTVGRGVSAWRAGATGVGCREGQQTADPAGRRLLCFPEGRSVELLHGDHDTSLTSYKFMMTRVRYHCTNPGDRPRRRAGT